jgi:hypothetical protein
MTPDIQSGFVEGKKIQQGDHIHDRLCKVIRLDLSKERLASAMGVM